VTRDDTHDQTTDDSTAAATSGDATEPRKRPRRRATRTVGAPTDVVVVPQGTGTGSDRDAPFELTLPVPAAERAAAEAVAAAPLEPAPTLDVLAELGVAAERIAQDEAKAEKPAEKPKRVRASRAKKPTVDTAAPVVPAAEPAAPEPDAAPAEQTPTADAAPARPKRQRATRSKAAAKVPAETPAPVETIAPDATEPVAATDAPASAEAREAAPESAPTVEQPAARTPGGPRLATTALLFQAPDPTTSPRRSRRAQAPAGPPRPADAAVPTFAAPTFAAPPSAAPSSVEPPRAPDSAPAAAPATAIEPAPADAAPTTARSRSRRASSRATGRPSASTDAPRQATRHAPLDLPVARDLPVAPDRPVVLDLPARVAAPFAVDALSAEERQAIDEVEVIESELVAEGVETELPEFAELDFVDDADDADETEADREPEGSEAGESAGEASAQRRRRRRGGRGRRSRAADDEGDSDEPRAVAPEQAEPDTGADEADTDESDTDGSTSRRRRRRRRTGGTGTGAAAESPRTVRPTDEVTALKGSTRLEAKRQRRREGRDAGRRRQIITEAEFLARRESVDRSMVVRELDGRTQIAVLEDGVLVEHYVSQQAQASMVGNVYLGRVQNVLPSMEAAFVDIGKGRNAVLYAGEVNWDAAGLEGQPRRIEQALKSGDAILVQVTKDPIGHKGARLTSQVTLAGRFLVFVPGGGMTGISRKLPDTERARLKKILREVVPEGAGVIVRTAAEGASEDELRADVARLQSQWEAIDAKVKKSSTSAPALLQGEPDLAIRVVRDIFNDDFGSLVVEGEGVWGEISSYLGELAPDLAERASKWVGGTGGVFTDVFQQHRIDEQLAKGMDRKVWLPSGGSLVIDRTEAMTVVDVNTGKFTGSGGTLEETVTRNNLEAAEEIVRQLRLRDIGGIIVIDFIDMVLESNRDLVLRRLVECLGRDRTKHQVAEVTSLGLVQMTRKRVGQGLVEAFSETCAACNGRGFIVHSDPIERNGGHGTAHTHAPVGSPQGAETEADDESGDPRRTSRRRRSSKPAEAAGASPSGAAQGVPVLPESRDAVKATLATIAAAAAHAHEHGGEHDTEHPGAHDHNDATAQDAVVVEVHEGRPEPVTDASEAVRIDLSDELASVRATESEADDTPEA
jgi:ribonuclease E